LAEAQKTLAQDQFVKFKSDVMNVLYEICGTHLDVEVLEKYTPDVLSQKDLEMIMQNSALARWM